MTSPERKRLHIAGAFVGIAGNLPYVAFAIFMSLFGGDESGGSNGGDAEGALIEGAIYLALIPLFIGRGVLRWWRFRYWIEGGEFRALDGAIIRREISIPFEKIRTVEVNEGLWQRMFGVVRLQVKTGATGTQVDLSAISAKEAQRLRQALESKGAVDDEHEAPPAEPTVRRETTMGELIAAGATSGQLGVVFIVAAWFLNQTASFTLQPLIDWFSALPSDETTTATLWVAATFAIIVSLILGFLGSIVATVLKYGKFSVSRDDDKITIQHGLLNRQTITVPLHRVQAIRFVQNPLRELTGSGSLVVEAIGHSEQKGRASELFPILGRDDLDEFLGEFLPEFVDSFDIVRPPKRALFRFLFLPVLITSAACGLGIFLIEGPWRWLFLPVVPAMAFARYLAYRQNGVGLSENVAQVESRAIFVRQIARLPRRAVRTAETTANLFQRRRNLGNAQLTVASGATGRVLTASNLDSEVVDGLLDWKPGGSPT